MSIISRITDIQKDSSMLFKVRSSSEGEWKLRERKNPFIRPGIYEGDEHPEIDFPEIVPPAYLLKNGPPGLPPRPGLKWKEETHRWIREDTGEEYSAFSNNTELSTVSLKWKQPTVLAGSKIKLPNDLLNPWGKPSKIAGKEAIVLFSESGKINATVFDEKGEFISGTIVDENRIEILDVPLIPDINVDYSKGYKYQNGSKIAREMLSSLEQDIQIVIWILIKNKIYILRIFLKL